jgi:hypothetical protein
MAVIASSSPRVVHSYLSECPYLVHERLDAFRNFVLLIFELPAVEIELLNAIKFSLFTLPSETSLKPVPRECRKLWS